jgi:hypothetical protein
MFEVYIVVWDPIRNKLGRYEEPATNLAMTEQEADKLLAELPIEPDYQGQGLALLAARKVRVAGECS